MAATSVTGPRLLALNWGQVAALSIVGVSLRRNLDATGTALALPKPVPTPTI